MTLKTDRETEELLARVAELETTVEDLAVIVFSTDTNSPNFFVRSWAIAMHAAYWAGLGWFVYDVAAWLFLGQPIFSL